MISFTIELLEYQRKGSCPRKLPAHLSKCSLDSRSDSDDLAQILIPSIACECQGFGVQDGPVEWIVRCDARGSLEHLLLKARLRTVYVSIVQTEGPVTEEPA